VIKIFTCCGLHEFPNLVQIFKYLNAPASIGVLPWLHDPHALSLLLLQLVKGLGELLITPVAIRTRLLVYVHPECQRHHVQVGLRCWMGSVLVGGRRVTETMVVVSHG